MTKFVTSTYAQPINTSKNLSSKMHPLFNFTHILLSRSLPLNLILQTNNLKMNKALFVCMVALVVVVGLVAVTEAVECNVMDLIDCLPAFTSTAQPTDECCKKLKEQEPCFCVFIKDPIFEHYFNSPEAKKVEDKCEISVPKCQIYISLLILLLLLL